jgi:hypothetical protein
MVSSETDVQSAARAEATTHSVLGLNERIVDSNDLNLRVLNGIAEDDTANAAEAVDADLDDHFV